MDDETAVFRHCRMTSARGLISDGAARTIASWYMDEILGQSFVSTGAVRGGVWEQLTDNGLMLRKVTGNHLLALNKLDAYLRHHQGRGPVPGWSGVWVR